ncbi:MAG: hypothetical protein ACT4QF_17975 [Sporichthyaceae bacterium]
MSYEDLAARIAALEERPDVQEGLRASQDRDLAALEQRTKVMLTLAQASALNVSELAEDMRKVRTTLVDHGTLLADIVTRLERMTG